jgi:hypothetical protein
MIQINKQYRTRSGSPVRILCVDAELANGYSVIGITQDGLPQVHAWASNGAYHPHDDNNSALDLVEVLPYEAFKIDEPILVRDRLDTKEIARHFAGVTESGKVKAWIDGTTSWTSKTKERPYNVWIYARRPTTDELDDK